MPKGITHLLCCAGPIYSNLRRRGNVLAVKVQLQETAARSQYLSIRNLCLECLDWIFPPPVYVVVVSQVKKEYTG